VASAVFSHPPVGSVGMTEAFARMQFGAVDIYRTSFRPLKHTLSGRDEKTMMKLWWTARPSASSGAYGRADAPEIVQSIAIA